MKEKRATAAAAGLLLPRRQALVDTLTAELVPEPEEVSEAEKVLQMLRDKGLLVEMGPAWDALIGDESDLPSVEEVREWLRGVPLSDWIIEDRGPR